MHLTGSAFHNAIMLQDRGNGHQKTTTVKQKAQAFHILTVILSFDIDFQFIPAIHLGPARQSRQYIVGTLFISFGNQVVLIP